MKQQKLYHKIVEEYLGRQLVNGEIVHHVNGNHRDNRLENLQVLTIAEHVNVHHLGKKRSDESRAKMSEADKGIPKPKPTGFGKHAGQRFKGVPKSPEHRAKLAASHIGMKASQETRDKMSAVRTGKTQSAETKKKHADVRLGMKYDDEWRRNISEGTKRAWIRRKEREMENLRNKEGSDDIFKRR